MPTILQRARAAIEGDRGGANTNTAGQPLYMPKQGACCVFLPVSGSCFCSFPRLNFSTTIGTRNHLSRRVGIVEDRLTLILSLLLRRHKRLSVLQT